MLVAVFAFITCPFSFVSDLLFFISGGFDTFNVYHSSAVLTTDHVIIFPGFFTAFWTVPYVVVLVNGGWHQHAEHVCPAHTEADRRAVAPARLA